MKFYGFIAQIIGRLMVVAAVLAMATFGEAVFSNTASADTLDWNTRPATDLRAGATDAALINGVTVTTSGAPFGAFDGAGPNTLAIEPGSTSNGTTGYINSIMNATVDDETASHLTTITFSEPVYNVSLTVGDIDGGPTFIQGGAAFNDIIEFRANSGTVLPTSGVPVNATKVTWTAATGRASANNFSVTDNTGDVTVTFAGPITSLTVRHIAGANSNVTNPTQQFTYIETVNYTRSPRVTLTKISNGGVGAFNFSGTNGFGSDTITTTVSGTGVTGATRTLTLASTATTLTEAIPSGYLVTAATCTGLGAGTATPNLAAGTIALDVAATAPGANIACTYTNGKRPTVLVAKISNGAVGAFNFSGDNGFGADTVTTTVSGTSVSGTVKTLTAASTITTLTEAIPAGYVVTSISCTGLGGGTATPNLGAGTVALNALATAAANNVVCTFTNQKTPTLKLQKTTVGNIGGPFNFSQTNLASIPAGITTTVVSTATPASPTAINVTTVGTAVTLTETAVTDFSVTAASCTDANSAITGNTGTFGTLAGSTLTIPAATVKAGSDFTCNFTNTDTRPRLTLVKTVTNDNGGTSAVSAFTLTATGPSTITGITGAAAVTNAPVSSGTYALSEAGPAGYTAGAWSCTAGTLAGSNLTLASGQTATCTINNDDISPRLTLVKTVTNDNGGTAAVAGFTLTATGPTTITGVTGAAAVTNAAVNVGTYALTEIGPAGYTAGAWSCTAGTLVGSNLTLALNQTATCTINNNDISPVLTLVKTVTNDNGGTSAVSAFTLTATGPTTITGVTGAASVTNANVNAGTYALTEAGPAGYTAGAWSCTAGTLVGSNLTLVSGQTATCTINNDDISPRLTLVKTVTNDNGGSAAVAAFTLTATGPTTITGLTGAAAVTNAAVNVGTYALTETGPAGYAAGAWSCTAGTLVGSNLTLALNQTATCTINNNDISPVLTLAKTVTNDNGGTAAVSAFTLTATGPTTITGVTGAAAITSAAVNAGTYALTETGPAGYAAGAWSCTAGILVGSNLTLASGQTATCTINNNDISPVLTLVKTVTNDNGGTSAVSAFTLTATGPTTITGITGAAAVTNAAVNVGTYALTETGPAGYAAGAWSCTAGTLVGSNLTLALNQTATCTVNNNDISPRLTLVKTVTNDNGGSSVVGAFTLTATGPTTITGITGAAAVTNAAVNVGTYALTETGPAGYAAGAWSCTAGTLVGSNLTLALNQTATCTINNNDISPVLTLVKTVTNDNGGTSAVSAFTLTATGPTTITGVTGAAAVTNAAVNVGTYALTESGPAGYTAGAWSCTAGTLVGSNLTLTLNQTATCTINNNDISPVLTLVKTVTNDNGGTSAVSAFTLTATGPTTITGVTGAAAVTNAAVNVGAYALTESGPAGYTAGAWSCTAGTLVGSNLTLALNQTATCTINNNDISPRLTLVKTVTNDNGGSVAVGAFTLTATGPTTITGVTGAAAVTNAAVNVGTYALTEAGPAGYTAGAWSCTAGTLVGSNLTLALNQTATCTINNNDISPVLTLVKTVTNDNGGASAVSAFTLTATGPTTITGVTGAAAVTNAAVNVGTYALTETGPAGYTAGAWSCTAGTLVGSNLTLALNQTATCTIDNNDISPRLTLVKTVTNDNGGGAAASAFALTATGPTTIAGVTGAAAVTNAAVNAGTYALTEAGPAGYTAGAWSCTAGTLVGSNLTLALNQTATCTINNNDISPVLTLVKTVTNDNGGSAAVSAFTLTATGPTTITGVTGAAAVTNAAVNVGTYALSETGPVGYTAGAWSCTAGTLTGSNLTLALNQTATCTINNNDTSPVLTLVKTVTNDNGGTSAVSAFTLTATGPTTINGVTGAASVTNAPVNVGTYTLSEAGPAGYTAGAWSCTAGTLAGSNLTLALNQTATCTINNNDISPRLTLVKTVTNDNGGSAAVAAFTLTATGPTTITGVTGAAAVTNAAVNAGTYALTETGPTGYVAGAWSCTAGTLVGSNLTLALNQTATCTINNNDISPRLTLVKTVTNDNGGTAAVSSFTLTATGPTTITGVTGAAAVTNAAVNVGSYALTETGPAGYTASAWSCTAGTLVGANLTLALNQTATCTINNNDRAATVTITKISNGGVGAFTFNGTAPSNGFLSQTITTVISGVGVTGVTQTLTASSTITTITETIPASYGLVSATCTGIGAGSAVLAGNVLTLNALATAPGNAVACTFTNQKLTSSLSVLKTANTAGPVVAGQTVIYSFVVKNTGSTPVTSIGISDTFNGFGIAPVPGNETLTLDVAPLGDSSNGTPNDGNWASLGPGDETTFTASYVVTQSDVDFLQ